jgi:hypothetical protein
MEALMKSTEETPVFPVTQLVVGPVPRLGFIVMRPDFLSNMLQSTEQAQTGRTYALTPVQARSLVEQIQKALAQLESASHSGGPGQRH